MENQRDDSPLYLFESAVEERADTCGLLDDWTVPEVFPMDLHAIVGEERRPPHRWFCIGPKRSGTTVHVDPLGTAAWNAVTHGVKRWALFPPAVPRHVVKAKHLLKRGEDDEAIMWFDFLLPRIREKYPDVPIYEVCCGCVLGSPSVPSEAGRSDLRTGRLVACSFEFDGLRRMHTELCFLLFPHSGVEEHAQGSEEIRRLVERALSPLLPRVGWFGRSRRLRRVGEGENCGAAEKKQKTERGGERKRGGER
ncbi:JmjC domain protein, partial [Toxoplasma gondii TgCatPRC2]